MLTPPCSEQVVAYALSRRSVKLVDTGLPFGKEGFTNFAGKTFDPKLRLTRRFYPHTYNVDGFFVARLQKVGPGPVHAAANGGETSTADGAEVDKTPIAAEDAENGHLEDGHSGAGDDFGGFDDDEDAKYMERAKRNAMRRRGLNPKALARTASNRTSGKKEKLAERENGEGASG